ncbi:MAG: hypothetical protein NVS3B14_21210 [Ktedonobacteraceae bacterium]
MQTVEVIPPKRGDPWKQFSLLSRRYLELLRNDVGNLMILILQAPVIALILYLMLASTNGGGTFNATAIANCPTSNGVPILLAPKGSGITSRNCTDVQNFLTGGSPLAQAYIAANGTTPDGQKRTTDQILQDFILPGSGGDAQKSLFIMAFAAFMFGCINGAREIVKEAPIYRRERTVNLGIIPYMFSKIAVLGMLCLIQSAILVLIVNLIARIQQGIFLPGPLEVYITMSLTSLAGLMIGLAVSAIAPNNDRAVSLVPILLIPQVIFSGILFKIDGPFLQIFSSIFAVRWGVAASGTSVGIHGEALNGDTWSFQGTLFSTHSQGEATLHLLLCWFALAAMIVILGVLIAYFLKRKDVRA